MSPFEYTLIVLAAVTAIIAILSLAISHRVHYREKIDIEAPLDKVFAAIRSQEDLMVWSAWPAATNSTCRVIGADNQVGTTIEFLSKGKITGSQTVTEIVPEERIKVSLSDPSPFGQRPYVIFHVRPLGESRTEVSLEFNNTIRRPFHLLLKGAGIVKWVRGLHCKDLAGLKAFCEN